MTESDQLIEVLDTRGSAAKIAARSARLTRSVIYGNIRTSAANG